MSWSGGMGMGLGIGGFLILVFWIVIVVLLISLARKRGGRDTAMDILKKRHARGEISRDEFENLKKEIEE